MVATPSVTTTEEPGIAAGAAGAGRAGRQDVHARGGPARQRRGRVGARERHLHRRSERALPARQGHGAQTSGLRRLHVPQPVHARRPHPHLQAHARRDRARPRFQIRPVRREGKSYQDDLAGTEFQQVATTTRAGHGGARQAEARRPGQHRGDRRRLPTRSPRRCRRPSDGGLWRSAAVDVRPDAGVERAGPDRRDGSPPTTRPSTCGSPNVLNKLVPEPRPSDPAGAAHPAHPADTVATDPPQGSVLGQMAQATPLAELRVTKTRRAAPHPPRPQRALPRRRPQPRAGHRPRRLGPGAGPQPRAREPVAAHQQGHLPRHARRATARRQPQRAASAPRSR